MKTKLKIKAFTLSEMLVVLALTAIVVGLAFTVLNLVTKQIQLVSTNYTTRLAIEQLETALWVDFNSYETIRFDPQNQQLVFNKPESQITYLLHREYTLRDQDTFPKIETIKTLFLGKKVEGGILDAVELQLGTHNLFIYKRSDASNYLND